MTNTPPNGSPDGAEFTPSMKALETILDRFKTGTLPLEESLQLFEQGVGHLKVCQEKLTSARGKVEELVQTLQAGGEAVTRPFEAEG